MSRTEEMDDLIRQREAMTQPNWRLCQCCDDGCDCGCLFHCPVHGEEVSRE